MRDGTPAIAESLGKLPDHAPKILDLKTSGDGKDVSEYDSEDMIGPIGSQNKATTFNLLNLQ